MFIFSVEKKYNGTFRVYIFLKIREENLKLNLVSSSNVKVSVVLDSLYGNSGGEMVQCCSLPF